MMTDGLDLASSSTDIFKWFDRRMSSMENKAHDKDAIILALLDRIAHIERDLKMVMGVE